MAEQVADSLAGTPALPLQPLVSSYSAMHFEGLRPGTHLGLPSRHLTVVLALGTPLRLAAMPDRTQRPASFTALAAGLHTSAVEIEHDGSQRTVSLELTPAGARSLLGLPARELAGTVVHLEDLLYPQSRELAERLAAAPDWRDCVAVLDEVLTRTAGRMADADRSIADAWRWIVASGGAIRVDDLARELGYSRRHLTDRFAREYGLTPKQAARVVRFERSWSSLRLLGRACSNERPGRPTLAEIAVSCGYYDQAHMAREWNEFVGCPPSAWLAAEELPFLQDAGTESAVASAA